MTTAHLSAKIGIRERLAQGTLIADGAMGTNLSRAGLTPGECPELWNVEHPEKIRAVHQAFADAGCELILTNTFGGSRIKLDRFGLGDRSTELTRAGVDVARQVDGVYVGASIGPTGELLEPLGKWTSDDLEAVFAEQVEGCAEADIVWIETMSDLGEAHAAVEGARRVTTLPIALTFTYETGPQGPRTMMGIAPVEVAKEFADVDVLGVNCTTSAVCLDVLRAYRSYLPDTPLAARPNAGKPRLRQGETFFPTGPRQMAQELAEMTTFATIVGGCCGTTPEHLAEVVKLLR